MTTITLKRSGVRAPVPNAKTNEFAKYVGKHVTIQTGHGVIYKGNLKSAENWLVLTDAEIVGTQHTALVDDLVLNRKSVKHLHAKPLVVKKAPTKGAPSPLTDRNLAEQLSVQKVYQKEGKK